MSDTRRLALLIAGGLLAVYAVGRCDGTRTADLGWHERNVATLAAHVRTQRAQLAAAIAAKDSNRRAVVASSDTLDTAQAATDTALAAAQDALDDANATNQTLRTRLGEVVAAVRLQQILTDSLQAAIVRDASAHLAEREAARQVIVAQQAVIDAQRKHIKALTPSRLRRLVRVTCTAGFAAGGAAVGVLVPAPSAPVLGASLGVVVAAGVCR